jgi:hypothetical protein
VPPVALGAVAPPELDGCVAPPLPEGRPELPPVEAGGPEAPPEAAGVLDELLPQEDEARAPRHAPTSNGRRQAVESLNMGVSL